MYELENRRRSLFGLLVVIIGVSIAFSLIFVLPSYILGELNQTQVFSPESISVAKEKTTLFQRIGIVIFFIAIVVGVLMFRLW